MDGHKLLILAFGTEGDVRPAFAMASTLADRGFKVAVATHSAWLFTLLNSCVDCADPQLAAWFLTGELRTVILSFEDYVLSDMDQQVKDAYGYSYPLPPKDDDGTVLDWATPNPNADLPDL